MIRLKSMKSMKDNRETNTDMLYKDVIQRCYTKMLYKDVIQTCYTNMLNFLNRFEVSNVLVPLLL